MVDLGHQKKGTPKEIWDSWLLINWIMFVFTDVYMHSNLPNLHLYKCGFHILIIN